MPYIYLSLHLRIGDRQRSGVVPFVRPAQINTEGQDHGVRRRRGDRKTEG